MVTVAKRQGLDVNVTIAAAMTLTVSIATSRRLLSTQYLPGTVIGALHKLSLRLWEACKVGIINLLIVQAQKWRLSDMQPLAQGQWRGRQENRGLPGSKPNAFPPH